MSCYFLQVFVPHWHASNLHHMLDLEIISVLQLSFHEGVGNHRTVIVEILTSSAIGNFKCRIVAPQAQRQTTKTLQELRGTSNTWAHSASNTNSRNPSTIWLPRHEKEPLPLPTAWQRSSSICKRSNSKRGGALVQKSKKKRTPF